MVVLNGSIKLLKPAGKMVLMLLQLLVMMMITQKIINNAAVWTVSTRLIISKSSSPCTNHWRLYQEHQLQLI